MTIEPTKQYAFTVYDACRFTGLCRTRLYQLTKTGELKSFKVGGRRMFMREDLEAFMDAAAEQTGSLF